VYQKKTTDKGKTNSVTTQLPTKRTQFNTPLTTAGEEQWHVQ